MTGVSGRVLLLPFWGKERPFSMSEAKYWVGGALMRSVEECSERGDFELLLSGWGSRVLRLPEEEVWVFWLPLELSMRGK